MNGIPVNNSFYWSNQTEKDFGQRFNLLLNLQGKPCLTNAIGNLPYTSAVDDVSEQILNCFKWTCKDVILIHATRTIAETDLIFFPRFHCDWSVSHQTQVWNYNEHFLKWRDTKDQTLRRVQAFRYFPDENEYTIGPINVRSHGPNKVCLVDISTGYDMF